MEDGVGEAGEEANVGPVVDLDAYFRRLWERKYIEGEPTWRNEDLVYSEFYSEHLTESEKDELLEVPASSLENFCMERDLFWYRNMLADAVMFFKLHKTWKVYICPSCECLRWFSEEDSLVLHLMYEHCNVWPLLRQNRTEEQWCAQALRSTVWKPIDVSVALDGLSTIYSRLDADQFGSLEWPLSEDFRRSELLGKLQKGFGLLLDSREGDPFTLKSYGCLIALIAVASEEILRHLDHVKILPPLPFRAILYCSFLSFRFMEAEPLCHFVDLVEEICLTRASQNRDLQGSKDVDVNWSKSECHDAVFFSTDCDFFVLDATKLKLYGGGDMDIGLWFYEAPIFPTIEKFPPLLKASEILQQAGKKAVAFFEFLKTVHAQFDLKQAGLTSFLKIWNIGLWPRSLCDTWYPELASNCESSSANVKDILPPCYSFRELAKRQRTEFHSQHYLELIKLTWELQFFDLEVCQLCAVDLRVYILALLRSFLRMKFYMIMRTKYAHWLKEEDSDEDCKMASSREEHTEEHVHQKFEGETIAEDGSYVMVPDLSSYKRSDKLSSAPLELRSSDNSVIGVSNHDLMMIDRERLGEEPPSANAGDTCSRVSQGASADTALSRTRTSIAAVVAESGAKPKAIHESDAEPESQLSQEVQFPVCCDFDIYSDSDDLSEPFESIDEASALKELSEMRKFSDVVWLMRGKCAWETKDKGVFVCMTINDVIKDCQEEFGLHAAQKIWEWRTNRTQQYWHCFQCDKSFPDQNSHMLHMEWEHDLVLSWGHDWFVPSHDVWKKGQSIEIEGVKERTHSLDDFIKVDRTYKIFIMEMEMLKSSYQNVKMVEVQNGNLSGQICSVQQQMACLVDMLDTKCKLRRTSESGELDAEIIQIVAKLEELKQNLSNLCVFDYKNKLMPSIHFFLQKRNLDSEFMAWVFQRLNELLCSIRCPCLPDSFSINLASPFKVIINIDENNAGITFAYVGICLKFSGVLSSKGSREVKGIFMFSGISDSDDVVEFDRTVVLDKQIKVTMKMFYFQTRLESHITFDLMKKLPQFQAECRRKIQSL